jgi:hypothetical protein
MDSIEHLMQVEIHWRLQRRRILRIFIDFIQEMMNIALIRYKKVKLAVKTHCQFKEANQYNNKNHFKK